MKHLDPNDPRFTAKALGENEALDINPEANEEFDSLQTFADTLKAELKAHDEPDSLTDEQKERVRATVETKKKKLVRFPTWINTVAACLVLGLLGIITYTMVEPLNTPILSGGKEDVERMLAEQEEIRRRQSTGSGATIPSESSQAAQIDDSTSNTPPIFGLSSNEKNLSAPEAAPTPAAEHPMIQSYAVGDEVSELDIGAGRSDSFTNALPTKVETARISDRDLIAQAAANRNQSNDEVAPTSYFRLSKEGKDNGPNPTPPAAASANTTTWSTVAVAEPKLKRILEGSSTRNSFVDPVRIQQEPWNREAYDRLVENNFKNPTDHPLSTFSIDVDTASYSNVRRFLNNGQLPPADAVRIEEMINYFSYEYEEPKDETPFAVHVDAATAPWNDDHRLVRIALQGETVDESERPDANLVFLIDVSGSMSNQNKLPLVQRSLNLLVDQMEARDRIAVVVYAGASGLALPSTTANNKETIQHAISNLKSGGSTNGGAGIELAYSVAQKHFIEDGINRVILCTDGDFNVGTTDRGSLTRLIEEKAKTGVFFSVLGFGMGNYQDAAMEELSNKGNGNYGYVDSLKEARKVFVDDMLGTLYTIAKDVKIQVEFNPQHVGSYRLIGYENRMLAKEDFNDDTKDAGEIGAGHRVTALYEIVPPQLADGKTPSVDPLKYQAATEAVAKSSEMLTVKLRYKQPDEDISSLIEKPFVDNGSALDATDDDFRFATSVASFGMLLRNSELIAGMSYKDVLKLAQNAKGNDSGGLRSEFIELVEKVITFQPNKETAPATGQPRE